MKKRLFMSRDGWRGEICYERRLQSLDPQSSTMIQPPPPSPLTCMTPDCKVLQGQPSIWEKVEHLLLNESGNLQPKPIVFDFIVVDCYIITMETTCTGANLIPSLP